MFAAFFGGTFERRPWAIKCENRRAGLPRESSSLLAGLVQLVALESLIAGEMAGAGRSQKPRIYLLLRGGEAAGFKFFLAAGAATDFNAD